MLRSRRTAVLGLAAASCGAAAALLGLAASPSAAGTAAACKSPRLTTVTVSMYEFGYTLKPKGPIHCGTVTFKQKNTGSASHNFDLQAHKAGKLLSPGQTTSFKLKLRPGKYTYLCDVLGHAQQGMVGTLVVK